jgi:hypothetical protein
LIHYWKLDEASGSQRFDSIGSLHLSENGGPVPSVIGKKNSAAQVENNYPISSSWSLASSFSVSVRLKFDSHLFDGWIVAFKNGAVNPTWLFILNDSDIPAFSNGFISVSATDPISIGEYHLLVGTFDGSLFKFSVDGSLFFTSAPGQTSDGGSGLLQLRDNSSGFLHDLDELAIWNRAISQSDVTSLWNSGIGRFLS